MPCNSVGNEVREARSEIDPAIKISAKKVGVLVDEEEEQA